ncbi:unnamed protein product [Closterium sp. NIES-64]|nr:unnamed protein product [Closterium sp. NIES-64]
MPATLTNEDEATKTVLESLGDLPPTSFLAPSSDLSQQLRTAVKALFDTGMSNLDAAKDAARDAASGGGKKGASGFTKSQSLAPERKLPGLFVDGFDSEQIWYQLDLAMAPTLPRIRRRLKRAEELMEGKAVGKDFFRVPKLVRGKGGKGEAGQGGGKVQGKEMRGKGGKGGKGREGEGDEEGSDEKERVQGLGLGGSEGESGEEEEEEDEEGLMREGRRRGIVMGSDEEDDEGEGDGEEEDEDELALMEEIRKARREEEEEGDGEEEEEGDEEDGEGAFEALYRAGSPGGGEEDDGDEGGRKKAQKKRALLDGAMIRYEDFFGRKAPESHLEADRVMRGEEEEDVEDVEVEEWDGEEEDEEEEGDEGEEEEDEEGEEEDEEEGEEEGKAVVERRKKGLLEEEEEEDEEGGEKEDEEPNSLYGILELLLRKHMRQVQEEKVLITMPKSLSEIRLKWLKKRMRQLEAAAGECSIHITFTSKSLYEIHLEQLRKRMPQLEAEMTANLCPKSLYEIRLERLRKPMRQLEEETGSRPKNSALAADLDFEHAARPAPVITEEVTQTIEEIIKKRILNQQFDDVERKAKPIATPVKGRLELDDNPSAQGLAEIYEAQFLKAAGQAPEGMSATEQIKHEVKRGGKGGVRMRRGGGGGEREQMREQIGWGVKAGQAPEAMSATEQIKHEVKRGGRGGLGKESGELLGLRKQVFLTLSRPTLRPSPTPAPLPRPPFSHPSPTPLPLLSHRRLVWMDNRMAQCDVPAGMDNRMAQCDVPAGMDNRMAQCDVPAGMDNRMAQCDVPAGMDNRMAQCDVPAGMDNRMAQCDVPAGMDNRMAQCDVPAGMDNRMAQCDVPAGMDNHMAQCDVPAGMDNHMAQCDVPAGMDNRMAQCDVPAGMDNRMAQCDVPAGMDNRMAQCDVPAGMDNRMAQCDIMDDIDVTANVPAIAMEEVAPMVVSTTSALRQRRCMQAGRRGGHRGGADPFSLTSAPGADTFSPLPSILTLLPTRWRQWRCQQQACWRQRRCLQAGRRAWGRPFFPFSMSLPIPTPHSPQVAPVAVSTASMLAPEEVFADGEEGMGAALALHLIAPVTDSPSLFQSLPPLPPLPYSPQVAPVAVSTASMLAPEEVFAGGEEGVGAGGGRRGSARGMVKGEGEMEREDRKRLRSKLKRKWKGEKAEEQKSSQAVPGMASGAGGAAAGSVGRKLRVVERGQQKHGLSDFTNSAKVFTHIQDIRASGSKKQRAAAPSQHEPQQIQAAALKL